MKIKRAFTKLKKISEMPLNITMTGINQMMRFYYHSSASLKEDNIELVCRELRILTHTIEKGMALPKIRKGFGKEKIKKILGLMDKYISIQNSEYDQEAFDYAYAILEKYIDNAAENECDISFIDLNKYQSYKKNQIEFCGTEIFDSQKLLSQIDSMNFEEFAKNRHSVRDFAVGTVDESIIRKAVELAQTAPSACNRQSTRVHYIQNRDICKNVLDLQGGAKGHTVSSVIVLTSELSLYRHTSEFKTPYLDSGIYLMNLLYALTYYGIGTCPLIWNDDGEKAEEIRRFVDIPWSEQIVAIIQVGHYATNECKYAASNRRAVFDVLKIH